MTKKPRTGIKAAPADAGNMFEWNAEIAGEVRPRTAAVRATAAAPPAARSRRSVLTESRSRGPRGTSRRTRRSRAASSG